MLGATSYHSQSVGQSFSQLQILTARMKMRGCLIRYFTRIMSNLQSAGGHRKTRIAFISTPVKVFSLAGGNELPLASFSQAILPMDSQTDTSPASNSSPHQYSDESPSKAS